MVPGKLTVEYLDGRRGRHVRPIRIFLFVNLVLFVTLRGSNGSVLKGPLHTSFTALFYGGSARRLAESRGSRWPGGMDAFTRAFDQHAAALAPSLVAVLIPALALVLIPNRPRGSGIRHVVLATHTVSAVIGIMTFLGIALSLGLLAMGSLGWIRGDIRSIDPVLVPAALLLQIAYFIAAIRRVYGLEPWKAALSGLLSATLGFAFAFWCFRAVLFLVTLWTLGPA